MDRVERSEYRGVHKLLAVGVLVVLVVVSCTWMAVLRLESRVRQMETQLQDVSAHLYGNVQTISSMVGSLQEESRWWTRPVVDVVQVENDEVVLQLTWQLRELRLDSKIALNYVVEGSEFERVVADEVSPGVYSVMISVNVPLEPVLHVEMVHVTTDGRRSSAPTEVLNRVTDTQTLRYFISMQDSEQLSTSEEQVLDLSKIGQGLFSPLQVTWTRGRGRGDSVRVIDRGGLRYSVVSAVVEARRADDEAVGSWQMTRIDEGYGCLFELDLPDDIEYESLVLQVEYPDGITGEWVLDSRARR